MNRRPRTRRGIALIAVGIMVLALAPATTARADDPATASVDPPPATTLRSGWKIQSSAVATDTGAVISDPAYQTAGWLPISQPETLMAALVENGRYPNIFFSNNLASVPTDQFEVNWWYRAAGAAAPPPGPAPLPGDERRAVAGQPVDQRHEDRRPGAAPGRVLPVRVRHHAVRAGRRQRDRARRVPQRLQQLDRLPHAEHGRLEPARAGQLDRPAVRSRVAQRRRGVGAGRPRRPGQRGRPEQLRPSPSRPTCATTPAPRRPRNCPARSPARAAAGSPSTPRSRSPRTPRSAPARRPRASITRRSGGRTRWATSRCTTWT